MFKSGKGVLFAFLAFATSLLGAVFMLFPFLPLAAFGSKWWRTVADRMLGYWLTFPASLVEWVFGSRFVVTGDVIDRHQPAIIVMNHRTRLDWLFLWNALYKMDPWLLTTEKISLKLGHNYEFEAPLRRIPGAGWAMGSGAYMFLERNFEHDRQLIDQMLQYYKESGCNYQLLFFAEGTDRGEKAVGISHAFADSNDLPRYDYVLHPRTTGFTFLLETMARQNYIRNVYDVTVAYKGEIIDTEKKLVTEGKFPEEVHFDVKKYDVSDVGDDSGRWLKDVWQEKEQRLKRFYEGDWRLEPSGEGNAWPVKTSGVGYAVAFAFWTMSSAMWIYFLYEYFLVKVYFAVAFGFYTYALRTHNGIDLLILKWYFGWKSYWEPQTDVRKGHD